MSALPPELSYGTLTGTIYVATKDGSDADLLPDAIPASGTVRLTCDTSYLSVAGIFVLFDPVVVTLDALGHFEVTLISGGSADISPTFFTWQLDLGDIFHGMRAIHFEVAPGSVTDIADLLPAQASAGIVVLRGPAGPAGPASTVPGPAGPAGADTVGVLDLHVHSPLPHPVYDDMIDLRLIYENGLI